MSPVGATPKLRVDYSPFSSREKKKLLKFEKTKPPEDRTPPVGRFTFSVLVGLKNWVLKYQPPVDYVEHNGV